MKPHLMEHKMKKIYFIVTLIFAPVFCYADNGMLNIQSPYSVKETTDKLETILIEKGMNIFNRVSHSEGAAAVGMPIRDTQILLFGNPKLGSVLMTCQQTVAIDLPQKALVWEDSSTNVWVSYNDPQYLKQRHGMVGCDEMIVKISAALPAMIKMAVE